MAKVLPGTVPDFLIGDQDIPLTYTGDLISSGEQAIGDVVDFSGNVGRSVTKIDPTGDPSARVAPVLTAAVPAVSNVTVHSSITRAWRAWMRSKSAKARGESLISPGDSVLDRKIVAKQPAYYVFESFHDIEQLNATGPNAISDTDPNVNGNVIYWEATSDKPKQKENARTATIRLP